MFFTQRSDGTWMPCGPKQPGAVQTTMQELDAKGLASQVRSDNQWHNFYFMSLLILLLLFVEFYLEYVNNCIFMLFRTPVGQPL